MLGASICFFLAMGACFAILWAGADWGLQNEMPAQEARAGGAQRPTDSTQKPTGPVLPMLRDYAGSYEPARLEEEARRAEAA